MNKEEKEAIKELKEEINKPVELPEDKFDTFILFNIKSAKTVLNYIYKLQKDNKELNLENQALYESINCNDDNMLARRYYRLQKENEDMRKELKVTSQMNSNLIVKLEKELENLKEVDRQICCEELITKDKYQEILKENEELKEDIKNMYDEIFVRNSLEYYGSLSEFEVNKILNQKEVKKWQH